VTAVAGALDRTLPATEHLRVLIVEDNPVDAELVELELMRGGYVLTVLRVQTAPALRAALEAGEWDIVLSDYSMPHFTGIEAVELLKASGKDIPSILISGTGGEDVAVRAMKAGAHDFFVKGNLALLVSAIQREVREARLRSMARAQHEEALDALWQSEERFRLLVNAVKDFAIFMLNPQLRITSWNPGAERMTGRTAEDVLGESIAALRAPDANEEDFARNFEQVRRQGSAEWDDAGIRKDGSRYVQHVYCTTMLNRAGELLGYVSIMRDVTVQRSLEAQLAQAQKLESLGQLAGGIAHDFNNMLMVIFSRCELLLLQVEVEKHRRFIADIRAAAMKNRDLTQQLLAAARQQVLEPQVVNVNDVVASTMQLLLPTLGEQVSIRTELDASLWNVHADPGKLHQVLLNLAINARDAMPGGGTLTIESRNVHVDSDYAKQHAGLREGDYVSLTVSDTGTGIPPEIRERVFDPFFTTKGPGRGTGLGLAVVHGIIEQTGGRIWMHTEEQRGTTFKIFLSRHSGAVKRDLVADETIPERGSETILLVEDEKLLRTVVRETLEEQGYRVLAAHTPAEALAISEGFLEPIHLVLTDVIMPGMTGKEMAESIVAARPDLRVIFMSGYSNHAVMNHAALLAEVRYLEKPVPTKVLLRAIRAALEEA
jgi:PAS domain S-box-containing protein